jgi:hypothetical protein
MEPVQIITAETLVTNQVMTPPEPLTSWPNAAESSTQHIRRFLKFMLPSIPVLAFSVDFLYGYIVEASADLAQHRPINEALPFLGALLVALVTSALCIFIYNGVLKLLEEKPQH